MLFSPLIIGLCRLAPLAPILDYVKRPNRGHIGGGVLPPAVHAYGSLYVDFRDKWLVVGGRKQVKTCGAEK